MEGGPQRQWKGWEFPGKSQEDFEHGIDVIWEEKIARAREDVEDQRRLLCLYK